MTELEKYIAEFKKFIRCRWHDVALTDLGKKYRMKSSTKAGVSKFEIHNDGQWEWIEMKDLKVGDRVRVSGVGVEAIVTNISRTVKGLPGKANGVAVVDFDVVDPIGRTS